MAFKRKLSNKFEVKVTVNVPAENGGFDANTFEAVFRRPKDKKELTDYEARPGLNDAQFVRDWMVGWKLVDEDSKQDVPFSEVELEALLAIEPTATATVSAFYTAYRGIKAKN